MAHVWLRRGCQISRLRCDPQTDLRSDKTQIHASLSLATLQSRYLRMVDAHYAHHVKVAHPSRFNPYDYQRRQTGIHPPGSGTMRFALTSASSTLMLYDALPSASKGAPRREGHRTSLTVPARSWTQPAGWRKSWALRQMTRSCAWPRKGFRVTVIEVVRGLQATAAIKPRIAIALKWFIRLVVSDMVRSCRLTATQPSWRDNCTPYNPPHRHPSQRRRARATRRLGAGHTDRRLRVGARPSDHQRESPRLRGPARPDTKLYPDTPPLDVTPSPLV